MQLSDDVVDTKWRCQWQCCVGAHMRRRTKLFSACCNSSACVLLKNCAIVGLLLIQSNASQLYRQSCSLSPGNKSTTRSNRAQIYRMLGEVAK
eukprot:6214512-Pleurochrysis_carterae.AAC.1